MLNNENVLELVAKLNDATLSDKEKENAWCSLTESCRQTFDVIVRCKGWTFTSNWEKEDFFQEVCLKVFTELPKYDCSRGSIITWFNMICKTVLGKHYEVKRRKEGDRVEISSTYYNEEGEEINLIDHYYSTKSVEEVVCCNHTWDAIWAGIDGLQENYRQVVMLVM